MAMPEKQPLDLVRLGAVEHIAASDLIPFRQPRVKHSVDNDIRHSGMVWVHARSSRRKDEAWFVRPNQMRDRESRLGRIANQPIMEREGCSVNAEEARCLFGLAFTDASTGVTRGLAVTEVDEQHGHPAAHKFRGRAAEDDFEVVRVRTECHDVVPLWPRRIAHRCPPYKDSTWATW